MCALCCSLDLTACSFGHIFRFHAMFVEEETDSNPTPYVVLCVRERRCSFVRCSFVGAVGVKEINAYIRTRANALELSPSVVLTRYLAYSIVLMLIVGQDNFYPDGRDVNGTRKGPACAGVRAATKSGRARRGGGRGDSGVCVFVYLYLCV